MNIKYFLYKGRRYLIELDALNIFSNYFSINRFEQNQNMFLLSESNFSSDMLDESI